MLHPRSEPQIYGVLDRLCSVVRMPLPRAELLLSWHASDEALMFSAPHAQVSTKLGQHYAAPCNRWGSRLQGLLCLHWYEEACDEACPLLQDHSAAQGRVGERHIRGRHGACAAPAVHGPDACMRRTRPVRLWGAVISAQGSLHSRGP